MFCLIFVFCVFVCFIVFVVCVYVGVVELDWCGYISEQQQCSVLVVEQDVEVINKCYYDSVFEEFLLELE